LFDYNKTKVASAGYMILPSTSSGTTVRHAFLASASNLYSDNAMTAPVVMGLINYSGENLSGLDIKVIGLTVTTIP
jgi:hypothetical protein